MLAALADNANDSGYCWPSLTYLASKCSLSRQGAINQLQGLEKSGLIAVKKTSGSSNHYQLCLSKLTPDTSQRNGLPLVNGVDHHQSTGLTRVVNGVDPNRNGTVSKPSGEGEVPILCESKLIRMEKNLERLEKKYERLKSNEFKKPHQVKEMNDIKVQIEKTNALVNPPL